MQENEDDIIQEIFDAAKIASETAKIDSDTEFMRKVCQFEYIVAFSCMIYFVLL